jgi:addiction module RelE/StbE family toxin
MVEIVWTDPALADLDQIADCIALDKPDAAKRLVQRVFHHIEQLAQHPESGSVPRELRPIKTYRQIVEKPCRVIYRKRDSEIVIIHVRRGEQQLRRSILRRKT